MITESTRQANVAAIQRDHQAKILGDHKAGVLSDYQADRDNARATEVSKGKPTDWEELKLAINNAIWMHAPESTTLKQADEAACRAISYISECYNKHHHA